MAGPAGLRTGGVPIGPGGWHTPVVTKTPDAPDTAASRETAVPLSPAALPELRRRVQAVLVATQILGGLGIATGVALAAVLATEVSGTDALAGLASTATVAGPALLAMPLAALMSRRGRRCQGRRAFWSLPECASHPVRWERPLSGVPR